MSEFVAFLGDLNLFSLLLGSIMLLMGFITLKFPPKGINHFYGYRTPRSMKNKENWDFAQKYAIKEMMRGGWILVFFSFSGLIYPTSKLVDTITGTILMTVIFIVLVIRTETGIKRFEASGKDN